MVECQEWEELLECLFTVTLDETEDKEVWALEKSGYFTTSSLYKLLCFPGVVNQNMKDVWDSKIPLKIKFFVWQVFNDKLQSDENLIKGKWLGHLECELCGVPDTTNHIVFTCILPVFIWNICKDELGWDSVPKCDETWLSNIMNGCSRKKRLRLIFLFGCVAWTLWLTRNDLIFRNIVLSSPLSCIYRVTSFLQKWNVLNGAEDRKWVAKVVSSLNSRAYVLQDSDGS